MDADGGDSLSVLDRVTGVLRAFDADDGGVSLSELARRSGLPKSTVSRVAAALVEHGYLERDGRILHLGLRVFELGQLARDPRDLRVAALPAMLELRERTGEGVHLGILDGDELVCVSVLRGRSGVPSGIRVGARLPAHHAAPDVIVVDRHPQPLSGQGRGGDAQAGGGVSCASCVFGEPGSQGEGEICVFSGPEGFDAGKIAPLLRAAAKSLTRRLSRGTFPRH
ncbi:IclR family transcriptional regulator [Microbacterium jiangjiandongii]|uniref:IclR family transcriptional regulator n=1 Tax=Microbacterium jiangjiandongii TaxID=3049071 RepID=UPI00214BE443|nr:helix-turn-helix domain-containing protein [Microbacterium sp. zg.Y843]MCR2816425.1 helix-turn-helix domain-containing protein [Microbacterium sp. zg.Y843]